MLYGFIRFSTVTDIVKKLGLYTVILVFVNYRTFIGILLATTFFAGLHGVYKIIRLTLRRPVYFRLSV